MDVDTPEGSSPVTVANANSDEKVALGKNVLRSRQEGETPYISIICAAQAPAKVPCTFNIPYDIYVFRYSAPLWIPQ